MLNSVFTAFASGGLLAVAFPVGTLLGFAWALDWSRRAKLVIIAAGLAAVPLSQILPAGNPLRDSVGQSLGALVFGAAVAVPFAGYAVLIRRLRRRAAEQEDGKPQRSGLGLIQHDAALQEDIGVHFTAMEAAAGAGTPDVFSVVWRDETGRIAASVRLSLRMGRAEVSNIWVEPDMRGEGIGAMLLRKAEEEARARGAKLCTATVRSWEAPGFLTRQGYDTALVQHFPARADTFEHIMEKGL